MNFRLRIVRCLCACTRRNRSLFNKRKIFFKWQPPESFIIFKIPTLSFIIFLVLKNWCASEYTQFFGEFAINYIESPYNNHNFHYWSLSRYWQINSVHICRESKIDLQKSMQTNSFFRIGVLYKFCKAKTWFIFMSVQILYTSTLNFTNKYFVLSIGDSNVIC